VQLFKPDEVEAALAESDRHSTAFEICWTTIKKTILVNWTKHI